MAPQPLSLPESAQSPIRVVAWDPAWTLRGRALAAEVAARIGTVATRVEHVGSTSIPAMAAKPVFDLQVSVLDLAVAAPVIDAALEHMGLTRMPWEHDHVPAGSDDPPERWVKRAWSRRGPAEEPVNLHARLVGSPNERLALLFRDWFRAHPQMVPAYSRFKLLLAGAVTDLDGYADIEEFRSSTWSSRSRNVGPPSPAGRPTEAGWGRRLRRAHRPEQIRHADAADAPRPGALTRLRSEVRVLYASTRIAGSPRPVWVAVPRRNGHRRRPRQRGPGGGYRGRSPRSQAMRWPTSR